jgi:hypothetical protein
MADDTERIHLEVRRPNYLLYGISIIADIFLGSADLPPKGPRVVAINAKGTECIVEQFSSMGKAEEQRIYLNEELRRIGAEPWCERHGMVPTFCEP